jgi:hypothetical protein
MQRQRSAATGQNCRRHKVPNSGGGFAAVGRASTRSARLGSLLIVRGGAVAKETCGRIVQAFFEGAALMVAA